MKLLAWHDRGRVDNRDGKDLGFVLSNYIEIKYEDLYALHEDLMIKPDFDRTITTARIMGRDIGDLLKNNTIALSQILQILSNEIIDTEYSRLAICLKEGGVNTYHIAFQSIQAPIAGITDKI